MWLTTERSSSVWLWKWCFPVSMVGIAPTSLQSTKTSEVVPCLVDKKPETGVTRRCKWHDAYLLFSTHDSPIAKVAIVRHSSTTELQSHSHTGPNPLPRISPIQARFLAINDYSNQIFSLSLSPPLPLSPPAKDNNNRPTNNQTIDGAIYVVLKLLTVTNSWLNGTGCLDDGDSLHVGAVGAGALITVILSKAFYHLYQLWGLQRLNHGRNWH